MENRYWFVMTILAFSVGFFATTLCVSVTAVKRTDQISEYACMLDSFYGVQECFKVVPAGCDSQKGFIRLSAPYLQNGKYLCAKASDFTLTTGTINLANIKQ